MKKAFRVFVGLTLCLSLWSLTGTAVAATISFADLLRSLAGMSVASAGIDDIDNLAFLYEEGDARPGTSVLKDHAYRYDLATDGNPLAGLTGFHEVAYLGYEAGNTNTLHTYGVVFTNNTSPVLSTERVDFDTAVFNDTIDGPVGVALTGTDYSYLDIYRVAGTFLKEWTGSDWFEDGKSYYVVGYEDGHPDDDFDDLVIAFEAVPIPPSALLLGSGIIGLIGFGLRRRSARLQG